MASATHAALHAVALPPGQTLEGIGHSGEAVDLLQELLLLSPQDIQGARYLSCRI